MANNSDSMVKQQPGYSIYLLYQKEVFNCDHAFLQSLMDWLYMTNDSPLKYMVRNKAFLSISRSGILIQKEEALKSESFDYTPTSWGSINFNLKHLKEIYVDKR
jgi:hypothetical protein